MILSASTIDAPIPTLSNQMPVFYTIFWKSGKILNCKTSVSRGLDDNAVAMVVRNLVSSDPKTNYGKKTVHIGKIDRSTGGKI